MKYKSKLSPTARTKLYDDPQAPSPHTLHLTLHVTQKELDDLTRLANQPHSRPQHRDIDSVYAEGILKFIHLRHLEALKADMEGTQNSSRATLAAPASAHTEVQAKWPCSSSPALEELVQQNYVDQGRIHTRSRAATYFLLHLPFIVPGLVIGLMVLLGVLLM